MSGKSERPSRKAVVLVDRLYHPSRKMIGILLLILVLIIAGGWIMIRQTQIHNEHEKFLQAKSDLHALAEQIVAQVGPPTEEKAVQSCGYGSSVVGNGARFCNVDEYLFYPADARQDTAAFANEVSSAISRFATVSAWKKNGSYSSTETLSSSSFSLGRFRQCGVQILSLTGNDSQAIKYPGFIVKQGMPGISIDMNCGDHALSEYFPVQE